MHLDTHGSFVVLGAATAAAVLLLRNCDVMYSDVISAVYVVPLYSQSSMDSEDSHCVPGDAAAADMNIISDNRILDVKH